MRQYIASPSRESSFLANVFFPIVFGSLLLLSAAGQAADSVGTVKFTRGQVSIESATGESRNAEAGDSLQQGELVVTGASSLAVIRLNDDSRMTLRPDSEFRVNQLNVEAGSGDSGKQQGAVLNLLRGGLRLVTGLIGKANPASYRLSTPVATIGIRGTEFNSRLCGDDCIAEEKELAGRDAAAKVKEGLYVTVDEGGVFLKNFAADNAVEIDQGESGYVADLYSLPVKLAAIPAFQREDVIPSPETLDFDAIEIPAAALVPVVPALPATTGSGSEESAVAVVAASDEKSAPIDISGTYELDVEYDKDVPNSFRQWFFGADPDIEFELEQKKDKISGEFDGDFEGTVKGVIDDNKVDVEFVLEARGGEYKDGAGNWVVQDNGDLVGKFHIRDKSRGIIRGTWFLTRE